jgi:hypothetical protein
MNFIFSTILVVIAYFLFPVDGFSFHFSDMTIVNLLGFLGSIVLGIMAISLLFKKY